MNFSQLQSLAALADTGSFTEAAERVHLTQSAVSHGLAALESELGVTLVERSRKGVAALTAAGERIMPHVRAMLAHAEAVEQEARAAQGRVAGRLRLASIQAFIPPHVLGSLLATFQQRYPEIEVVLFEGALQDVGEWIQQSVVDLGLVLLPARGTISTQIATDELIVLVPADHALRSRAAVRHEELLDEGFILEKTNCALHVLAQAGFSFGGQRPNIRYQANDSATIFAMVREGLGITIAPRHMLPSKQDGMAILRLDPPQPLLIGLAARAKTPVSPAASRFTEVAADWASQQSAADWFSEA